MNFYKEFIINTLEISLAIFIIIFGYFVWNNFDLNNYYTAKYYDNIEYYEVYLEDNEQISFYENENNLEYSKLYLHNISNKNNNTLLTLKIEKENITLINNMIIKIDNKYYEINNLDYKEDDFYFYFIIDDITFNSYETKEYNIKILLKDKIKTNINEFLNYEFTTYA